MNLTQVSKMTILTLNLNRFLSLCSVNLQEENYRYTDPIIRRNAKKWVSFLRNVIRTCIGCRGKFSQKTLIRFVCQGDETLQMDGPKKLAGRGAYVCYSQSCIQKAFQSPKRINSLLRVRLTNRVIAQFEQVLLECTKNHDPNRKKEELS